MSSTIKKNEHQRIDAFELWCWRRLLRVLWTARRSNQSILRKSVLNIHWKNWCWTWNSNTLATWTDSLEKTLLLGKIEGRRRGWPKIRCWMASLTQWTWVWVSSGSWWWTGKPGMLQSIKLQRVGHDWVNWIELNWSCRYLYPNSSRKLSLKIIGWYGYLQFFDFQSTS